VRPGVDGDQLGHVDHTVLAVDPLSHGRHHLRCDAAVDEQFAVDVQQHDRGGEQQHADDEAGVRVGTRIAGRLVHRKSDDADEAARDRGGVVEDQRARAGVGSVPQAAPEADALDDRRALERADRLDERPGVRDRDHRQHDVAEQVRLAAVVGAAERRDAVGDGHRAAADEHAHGREQRPEERLTAVAERMRVVGRAGGPPDAHQQEHLHARARDALRRLREQHSRAAAPRSETQHRRLDEHHRQRHGDRPGARRRQLLLLDLLERIWRVGHRRQPATSISTLPTAPDSTAACAAAA
jgi:hypothetical protein